jgi:hypothetical protein
MLRVQAQLGEGKRLRNMPAGWFLLPAELDLSDVMVAAAVNAHIAWLIDCGEYERARAFSESLSADEMGKMLELYQNEIMSERLFLELIGECREDKIKHFQTESLRKHIELMLSHVSKQRLLYAIAKLAERDDAKAEGIRKDFDRACATYPYTGDLESERELMALVDSRAGSVC